MRKILILGCLSVFVIISCAPATAVVTVTPVSTSVIPTDIPTLTANAVMETSPPPCQEAELIYHTQLQQLLLVNCVPDPSRETPSVIWGWNGTRWQKVTEGGPPGPILGTGPVGPGVVALVAVASGDQVTTRTGETVRKVAAAGGAR